MCVVFVFLVVFVLCCVVCYVLRVCVCVSVSMMVLRLLRVWAWCVVCSEWCVVCGVCVCVCGYLNSIASGCSLDSLLSGERTQKVLHTTSICGN